MACIVGSPVAFQRRDVTRRCPPPTPPDRLRRLPACTRSRPSLERLAGQSCDQRSPNGAAGDQPTYDVSEAGGVGESPSALLRRCSPGRRPPVDGPPCALHCCCEPIPWCAGAPCGNLQPEGEMDMLTTNRQDYPRKAVDHSIVKRPSMRREPGKFDGKTSYKDEFQDWPRDRVKHAQKEPYNPPEEPFQGSSTYRDNYTDKKEPPRATLKPSELDWTSRMPFDDKTAYRGDFVKHPLSKKLQRERQKWQPPVSKLDDSTNYKSDFTNKQQPVRMPCQPDRQAVRSDVPFDGNTTQRGDFQKWDAQPPDSCKPKEYIKPLGDIDLTTTNRNDYTKKPVDHNIVKHMQKRQIPGQFHGKTGYKDDYQDWPRDRVQHAHKEQYNPPEEPFQGSSTYRDNYTDKKEPPRATLKPSELDWTSQMPFDDKTAYRGDFVKHPLSRQLKRERQKWQPPISKLDDSTNYRSDFTNKQQPVRMPCQPDRQAVRSDVPFDGNTTQRGDFQKWDAQPPDSCKPKEYIKPLGDIDLTTTNRNDYTKKPLDHNIVKHMQKRQIPGQFHGKTGYKDDYQDWPRDRVQHAQKEQYNPPEEPFQGSSTYRDNYNDKKEPPRATLKPLELDWASNMPFDDKTAYRVDFVKHPLSKKLPREKQQWQPPAAKLDDSTNYKTDFTNKKQPMRMTCQPDRQAVRSDAPFDGTTTQRGDYQKWQLPPRCTPRPACYCKAKYAAASLPTRTRYCADHAGNARPTCVDVRRASRDGDRRAYCCCVPCAPVSAVDARTVCV